MAELRLPRIFQSAHGVRSGMARESRRTSRASGRRCASRIFRNGKARAVARAQLGWRSLAVVVALLFVGAAQAQVLSSRIWPARDYTRLTLESKSEIKHRVFSLKDPERLALGLATR